MKIRLLGADLFHADEETMDGQRERERERERERHNDRRDEANCRFSQFCKSAQKLAFLFVSYKRGHIAAFVHLLRIDVSLLSWIERCGVLVTIFNHQLF